MNETVERNRKYGVLNSGIVWPRKGGRYELISGHRRKRALEILGITLSSASLQTILCNDGTF
ncbi:MAG: ParB N-terminal domain-containing protein [Eubacterium sp.]|nr:ParB N-terminal domain-containing protein [Eubacterium sp.]